MKIRVWVGLALVLILLLSACQKTGEGSTEQPVNSETENETAEILRRGLRELGVDFFGTSPTNQVFPILPAALVKELAHDFFFYEWAKETDGMIPIRLVTGWGTTRDDAEAFIKRTAELLR